MNLRYTIPLDAKAADADGILEGYASTFGPPPDSVGDIIEPGAFSASLERHKRDGTMPAMLWGHNQAEPIGKWLSFDEDGIGLRARGRLTLSVQKGHDAYQLARDDALGLSIGYRPVKARPEKGANIIEAVDLHEVSLVGLAANSRARITAVKSLSGLSIREFERVLRDTFDLSSREAKRLSMGGYKALCGDDPSAEIHEIAAELRRSATRFQR